MSDAGGDHGHGESHGKAWWVGAASLGLFGLAAMFAFPSIGSGIGDLLTGVGRGVVNLASGMASSRAGIMMIGQAGVMIAIGIAAVRYSFLFDKISAAKAKNDAEKAKLIAELAAARKKTPGP